jgi:hypothetical protein
VNSLANQTTNETVNNSSRFAKQGRVAPQSRRINTTLPITQPKMAHAIFGFGLSLAPKRSAELVQKNV